MLNISNLTVLYGGMIAVNDVSLRAESREIVCIIGSNGAGKTSIIRGISGLVSFKAKEISFENKRIDQLSAHEIVREGVVQIPEGRGIFARLKVLENLLLGAFCQKERRRKDETLERVLQLFPDLKSALHRRANTLSGGQQQMLAIGRGLMSNPKLLMLDEPSLGVAPMLVESIFETIKKINEEGVTILLVEQRVRESLEMGHRGYVLQTGKIALEGEARDLLNSDMIQKHYLGM